MSLPKGIPLFSQVVCQLGRCFGLAAKPAKWLMCTSLIIVSSVATIALSDTNSRSDTTVREFNVRVPMRDGVILSADIYRPSAPEKVPVVLIRTPYTKSTMKYAELGVWWADHGYAFVVQDVRGRGDSAGAFYPLVNEAVDGFDTLAWIGAQTWSNGNVGMMGSSYLGWTQLYAAGERSPFLKAIIPAVAPPDPDRNFPKSNGVLMLEGIEWLSLIDGHTNQDRSPVDLDAVFRGLPLATLDARLGRNLPAWRDWVNHATHDEYWKGQSYEGKLANAQIPILLIDGWYDPVLPGATRNFINLSGATSDPQTLLQQHLLIGPWPHAINLYRQLGAIDFGPAALIDLPALQLRWFDHWLKGINNGVDKEARVHIFALGINRWFDESEWPIARTVYRKYFLHSGGHANSRLGDGQLSPTEPSKELPDHFRYDPSDPVPFLHVLSVTNREAQDPEASGPDDYRDVETRPDVLVYTSAPFDEPTMICGPLRVNLYAATNARDTDWTARVLDVHPDGFAQQLNQGIVRGRFRQGDEKEILLTPGETYDYDIDALSTCDELQKGHKVRLEVSSSAFPWFDRNLNTGGKLGVESRGIIAEQTVVHNRLHASYVLLPIVPPRPWRPIDTRPVAPRAAACRCAAKDRGAKDQKTMHTAAAKPKYQDILTVH